MSFYVAGVEYLYDHDEWFVINNTNFYQMTAYTNVTAGLELYCVNTMDSVGKHSHTHYSSDDARCGMAVRADAITSALAHEIGHACKLDDLEYELNDLVSEVLAGAPNWSGGEGTGYHDPALKQRDLVKRVLMYHQAASTITDIPLGDVAGTYVSWGGGSIKTNFVTCGLDYMETVGRAPSH